MRISLLICLILFFASCQFSSNSDKGIFSNTVVGKGDLASKNINLSGSFSSVQNNTFADVHIVQDKDAALNCKIAAQQNILELFTFEIKAGKLIIDTKPNSSISTNKEVIVYLNANVLNDITLSGSGDMTVKYNNQIDELTLQIDGSGNLNCQHADAQKVDINLNGSGDIEFKESHTQTLDAEVNGSGDIDASALSTQKANIQINGSGSVGTRVVEDLVVEINGSGDVNYSGSPELHSSINGSGEVLKSNQ